MGKVTRRLMSKRLCRANWGLKAAWICSRSEWFCVWTLWARILSHCSFNLPFFLQGRACLPSLELKQNQIHPLSQLLSPTEVCECQCSLQACGGLCVSSTETQSCPCVELGEHFIGNDGSCGIFTFLLPDKLCSLRITPSLTNWSVLNISPKALW